MSGNKINVMAIDDSPEVLELIRAFLMEDEFVLRTVTEAEKAFRELEDSIEVIILDLMMPRMSGFEFLERLRSSDEYKELPVIVLTALDSNATLVERIFKMGANDYVRKPFVSSELIARIRQQAGYKRTKEELVRTNSELSEELKKNQALHDITTSYATTIENELLDKIKEISSRSSLNDEYVNRLVEENKGFKKEIEKLNILYNTVVMHDSIIEDEMNEKLEQVTHQATVDQLTQIYNRFKFYESLYSELESVNSTGAPLSIIMLDIDHFKSINDTYGHDVGDVVLVEVTKLVKTLVRKSDTFARWGGEEFMLLVPGSELEETRLLAQRMCEKMAAHIFPEVGTVTCSFGVTLYQTGDDIDVFLKRVDGALYDAKESGRNRVCFR